MFNFLPKDEKFYDELEALSQHVVSASGELKGVVEKFPQVDGMLGTIENDRVAARKIYQESLLGSIRPSSRHSTVKTSST